MGENDIVKTISVECPLDESELPLRIEVTTTPKITKAVIEELKPWHRRTVIEGRTITAQMIRSRLAKRKNREKNASLMVTVREQTRAKWWRERADHSKSNHGTGSRNTTYSSARRQGTNTSTGGSKSSCDGRAS